MASIASKVSFNIHHCTSFQICSYYRPALRYQIAVRSSLQVQSLSTTISSPLSLVAFTLIIDDLVFWDGTTMMAQLGGGGPQTLYGYRLFTSAAPHSSNVGLAAGVGIDLPPQCMQWLLDNGVDTQGLVVHQDCATPRAWQVLESDGRRYEIWRSLLSLEARTAMLLPSLTTLPPPYQSAACYHLCIHPEYPPLDLLTQLRHAVGPQGLVSVETFTHATRPVPREILAALFDLCDVFSPNEREAVSMIYGDCAIDPGMLAANPTLLTQPFTDAGAAKVAVRRGPLGAIVAETAQLDGTVTTYIVPAVPGTKVVDVTGCGNAFCGGMLAGLEAGLALSEAARWGCVAGSIVAEHQALSVPSAEGMRDEVQRRLEMIHACVI